MKIAFYSLLTALFICGVGISASSAKGYIVPIRTVSVTKYDSMPVGPLQIRFINDSDNSVTIKWAIIEDGFAKTGWDYSFCDLNQCFVSTYPKNYTDLLLQNDTGAFSMTILHFNNIADSATMKIAVWDSKDIHNVDTITMTVNAKLLGIGKVSVPSPVIGIFPNPATDFIEVNANQTGFVPTEATVYNTLGKVVLTQNISGNTNRLPIYDLPKGVYVLNVQDRSGREAIKQFIKE